MQNQSLFPQNAPTASERVARRMMGLFQRTIQTWLRLSGPNVQRFRTTIEDQELLRRSRLLSALFSLIFIVVILAAPTAIPVPTYWIPIIAFLVLSLVALALNRSAQITLSAIFYILAIDTTLVILMITLPSGIRNSNIPDFDLFIIPILIGGVVLPRWLLPFLAAAHICIIIALFTLLPHDPLLTREILVNQKGFAYGEISDALILQVVCATIAWLGALSVDRALLRANRAEDLAEAQKRLSEHAQLILEQKQRLDYGIGVLKGAHARFANGDYKARAKLENNELTSLAFSFNLMVERLNRIAQIAQEYIRLERGLRQMLEVENTIFHGGPLQPFHATGTAIDRLYPSFQRYYTLRQAVAQSGSSVDQVRVSLTQQKALLAQLASILTQIYTPAQLPSHNLQTFHPSSVELLEKAQQLCVQINNQEKRCLQETTLLGQLLREP
jgi:hypothetical protein